jgi:hypothetical protein
VEVAKVGEPIGISRALKASEVARTQQRERVVLAEQKRLVLVDY